MFSLAVLFQIVTLPVEYNASHRAVALLDSIGILEGRGRTDQTGIKSAALTYVAATPIPAAAFKTSICLKQTKMTRKGHDMAKAIDRGLENREIVPGILTEVLDKGNFCPSGIKSGFK